MSVSRRIFLTGLLAAPLAALGRLLPKRRTTTLIYEGKAAGYGGMPGVGLPFKDIAEYDIGHDPFRLRDYKTAGGLKALNRDLRAPEGYIPGVFWRRGEA